MKRIVFVSIILLLAAAVLPGLFIRPGEAADEPVETQQLSFAARADRDDRLKVLTKDGPVSMTMHDYLVGVVAAEMPAKFLPEALKAQAVAARTYAMYGVLIGKKTCGRRRLHRSRLLSGPVFRRTA
jgi:stage II sporulation protein D